MMRDPLAAELLGRGVYNGTVRMGAAFVAITPGERDKIVTRLEMDRANMVCTSCGSTKPQSYYDAIGAISCCEARAMVETTDLLCELLDLRKRKRRPRKSAVAA